MSVERQVEAARSGTEPALISQVSSGWVVLCNMQFLRGYCILMADPVVPSLNNLDSKKRATFLADMTIVGDALQEITGVYRINYAIMGNTDKTLHAHIVPRYLNEPEEFRLNAPWSYPQDVMDDMLFEYERDKDLMAQIKASMEKRFEL